MRKWPHRRGTAWCWSRYPPREAVDKALAGLRKTLDKLVEKGKLTDQPTDGMPMDV